MGGAQMRAHSQLAVHECRNRLSGQMLGGTELAGRTDRRVALRCELGGEPGERAAEHMSPVGHHHSFRHCAVLGTTSNVARTAQSPTASKRGQNISVWLRS